MSLMQRVLLGMPLITLRGNLSKLYESKQWLYQRYVIDKKNIIDMAKEAGCSHMKIQRALDKHALIKRR